MKNKLQNFISRVCILGSSIDPITVSIKVQARNRTQQLG
jgi:hypothetical protein